MLSNKASWSPLRSAAFGSIGAAYATIGTALTERAIVIAFKNATNGDVVVSTNGTADHLYMPAGSYAIWDVRTNAPFHTDYLFAIGTQFYVKDGSVATSSGSFYIEVLQATEGV